MPTGLGLGSAPRQNSTIMLWVCQYGKLQETLEEERLPPGSSGLLPQWSAVPGAGSALASSGAGPEHPRTDHAALQCTVTAARLL